MGCDLAVLGYRQVVGVSIHAPTWGATLRPLVSALMERFQSTHPHGVRPLLQGAEVSAEMFQSTHPHGVRHDQERKMMSDCAFQSTHPHGVRPNITCIQILAQSFNPRTHMGCDTKPVKSYLSKTDVSIHAPTWGATNGDTQKYVPKEVSIHAPTWGATLL